jgi:hypothetical protein
MMSWQTSRTTTNMLSCTTSPTLVRESRYRDDTRAHGNPEYDVAVAELKKLLSDLQSAGLNTEVRPGYDQSLLVFVQAPRELLGNTVYKSRCASLLFYSDNC